MLLARGNPMTFLQRPISAGLLLVAGVMLAAVLLPKIRRGRDEAFQE
jgi:TctA family transporter